MSKTSNKKSKEYKSLYTFYSINAQDVNEKEETVKGKGHICLAIQFPKKKTSAKFKVAVSFKNPMDWQNFDFGKNIALQRLIKNKKTFTIKISSRLESVVKATVMAALLQRTRVIYRRGRQVEISALPRWLVRAVQGGNRLAEISGATTIETTPVDFG